MEIKVKAIQEMPLLDRLIDIAFEDYGSFKRKFDQDINEASLIEFRIIDLTYTLLIKQLQQVTNRTPQKH